MSTIGPEFSHFTNLAPQKTRKLDLQNFNIGIDVYQSDSKPSAMKDHPFKTNVTSPSIHIPNNVYTPSSEHITIDPQQILKSIQNIRPSHKDNPTLIADMFFASLLNESLFTSKNKLVGNLDFLMRELNSISFKIFMSTGNETLPGFESLYSFNDLKTTSGENNAKQFLMRYNITPNSNADVHTYSEIADQAYNEPSFDSHDVNNTDTHNHESTNDFNSTAVPERTTNNNSTTIDNTVYHWYKEARSVRKSAIYDNQDIHMLELYDMLHTAGAPMYLFEQLTSWAQRASKSFGTSKIPGRDCFLSSISQKVYGKDLSEALKPKSINHTLPSTDSTIKISVFSFKAQLTSLLLNESIMLEENLLMNPDNPFEPIDHQDVLDDLDSGWWYQETRDEVCTEENDILVPIILFVDAGKVTHRLSVEPITFTLGIFNRSTRANADAWRTLGYIENLDNSSRSAKKTYNPSDKLRDYHSIINLILQEYRGLQGKHNGTRFPLELKGKTYHVTFKFAVQNIQGDCAGLDKLCLMYGSHNLLKARLCRDCMVTPDESDDPYHICKYITSDDVKDKSDDELKSMSLHPVPNAFHHIYFGARNCSVYESTPSEPLHAILLGLVKYEYEVFEKTISKKSLRLINQSIQYFYNQFSRQNSQNLPSLAPFQNGIDNCDVLGAKEQYARLFAIFISMMNRDVFESLCIQKRKKYNHLTEVTDTVEGLGIDLTTRWFRIIEDTLTLYQWVMKPSHNRNDLIAENAQDKYDAENSKAQNRIRQFMSDYKCLMNERGGHGLKIVKFHQLLHYPKEILKDSSAQNIDTGRCESIAVTMYKRIAKWTQRRQTLLTQQLAFRHFQYSVAEEGIRLQAHEMSTRKCNLLSSDTTSVSTINEGSRFCISLNPLITGSNPMKRSIQLKWIGTNSDVSALHNVIQLLTKRLYLNTEDGGCLKHSSKVNGFTEYRSDNGYLYRAHPNYRSNGKWFDWCKIKWEEQEDEVPAKILMFLDLTDSEIMSEEEQDELLETFKNHPESNQVCIQRQRNRRRIPFLSNSKWAVIRSAKSCDDHDESTQRLNNRNKIYNIRSSICSRVVLEEECRLIEVSSISMPCYALPCANNVTFEECDEYFVLQNLREWGDVFLNNT